MNNSLGSSSDSAAGVLAGFFGCYLLFILVIMVFMIFIYYKIIQKTGNSGWLSLLMLVPLANLGLMIWLAFSDWPVASIWTTLGRAASATSAIASAKAL